MSHSHNHDEHFSEDLQKVADVLREGRPTLDPLALDRVKLRAMSAARRSTSSPNKGSFMKSRITALVSVGFLMLGTGGTMALAGGDGGGSSAGSASFHQYRPPCDHGQGRGGDHECHGHEGEHGDGGHGGGDHGGGGDHHGGGQGGGDHGGGKGGGEHSGGNGGHDSGHGHNGGHGHH
ncbi:MAG TPA: hypothetical protein VGY76_03220 [Solirubrobacteraceae bacterium]|nr:hypothetical protein [Solirubrobacteraceae bacterium]